MDDLSRTLSGCAPADRQRCDARHQVQTLKLGPMQNLVYVIRDRDNGRAAVVDPGWDAGAIMLVIAEDDLPLSDILITHGHMAEQRRANPFLHFDGAEAFCSFRAEHNRHRHPPYRPVPRGWSAW